jgi:tetratricopeptide (TPR) repeat protein
MNRKQQRAGRTHGTPGSGGPGKTVLPADQLFQLGLAYHNEGRLAEADGFFRRALQFDPNHSGCLNRLGIIAHQSGQPEEAVRLIGQAIAADDSIAEYRYNIGLIFAGLGRMDEAVAHNRRAVSLEPGYADAHTNLGGALAALGIGTKLHCTSAARWRARPIRPSRIIIFPSPCWRRASSKTPCRFWPAGSRSRRPMS